MILLFNDWMKICEDREIKNASLFTRNEFLLIEDLLVEYIDKYNMIKMPLVDDYHHFDSEQNRIQYLVQRLRNISIEIESNNPLNHVFEDIEENLIPRIKKYGYHIYHSKLESYEDKHEISITVFKDF